jgi:biotin operon repressor
MTETTRQQFDLTIYDDDEVEEVALNNNGLKIYSQLGTIDVAPATTKRRPPKLTDTGTVMMFNIEPVKRPAVTYKEFSTLTLPAEVMPNAGKTLNNRLSLRDKFGIMEFTEKLNTNQYKNPADMLNDLLRLCFKANTDRDWMIKRPIPFTGNSKKLSNVYVPISEDELRREITCGRKDVWKCLQENKQHFQCQGVTFNSDISGYKKTFEGWNYDILDNPDYSIINLYLEHIRLYWCGGDQTIFEYVMKWLAHLLQYPGSKAGTAIVAIGPEGVGKNIITDQLKALTDPYSKTIDDISEVTGKFNPVLENVVLLIGNELKSDKKGQTKTVDKERLKSVITELTVRIERKFKDKIDAENVANFIFLSNNFSPFKQEVGDRRNLDLQCSMPENPEQYFGPKGGTDPKTLGGSIQQPMFMETLYTYLMTYEVAIDYDFVHNLPMTALKQVIQATYKNPFEIFITTHWELFVDGWNSKQCKERAQHEIIDKMEGNEAKEYHKKGLTLDLMKYCGPAKQIRKGEGREYVYKLLPNYIPLFKPTGEQLANGEVDELAEQYL